MSLPIKYLLTQAIQQTPSADNSQPWHITWTDSILSLSYDTARVADKTFPSNSPAILLSIGAAIENLYQVACQLNIDINIDTSLYIECENPTYFRAHFKQSDLDKPITVDSIPVFERHTNRLAYTSTPIAEDILAVLKNLTLGSASLRIISDKKEIKILGKLVQKASEIRFKTQEINEWLAKSLRFGNDAEKTKDGLDVATLDLPPGGSLFLRLIGNWKRMQLLNLLGTYLTMSLIDSAPVKKAPALIAITAPSNAQGIMEAGQLMEKVWIDLNSKGIAAHPYYVICDQLHRRKSGVIPKGLEKKADMIYAETQQLFQFEEGKELQMLLRIGHPKKTAKRSQRLDFNKFCSGL